MRSSDLSIKEFTNEREPILVHWRVIEEQGKYFVYRRVQITGIQRPAFNSDNGVITEYLTRSGEVDSVCDDHAVFHDYCEIGQAFILNHGRELAGGTRAFYTTGHYARLYPEEAKADRQSTVDKINDLLSTML